MNYREFIEEVRCRARLATFDEAVTATQATLATLRERMPAGQANDLGAQLPEEVGLYLMEGNKGESFDLDEFFDRVMAREGTDLTQAVFHAGVVLQVLREQADPRLVEEILEGLPDDYSQFARTGRTLSWPGSTTRGAWH